MRAVPFAGADTVFGPPPGMEDRCDSMPALVGEMGADPVVVSCHEMSDDELRLVAATRRVFLVTVGAGRQPVSVTAVDPVAAGWVR